MNTSKLTFHTHPCGTETVVWLSANNEPFEVAHGLSAVVQDKVPFELELVEQGMDCDLWRLKNPNEFVSGATYLAKPITATENPPISYSCLWTLLYLDYKRQLIDEDTVGDLEWARVRAGEIRTPRVEDAPEMAHANQMHDILKRVVKPYLNSDIIPEWFDDVVKVLSDIERLREVVSQ